jgi:tryptophan-rich sensory protein
VFVFEVSPVTVGLPAVRYKKKFGTPIFFNLQAFGPAFFWLLLLWGLVLWMILSFRKVDNPAANLHIPYLLWLTFAAYLNLGVWYLNR